MQPGKTKNIQICKFIKIEFIYIIFYCCVAYESFREKKNLLLAIFLF